MNRLGKVTSGIIWGLIAVGTIIRMSKYQEPAWQFIFDAVIWIPFAFPLLLSLFFRFLNRNRSNKFRWQWLPNGLNIISIILIGFAVIAEIKRPLKNSQKLKIEEKRMERAVIKWIKENALHPDTYRACYFSPGQVSDPRMKGDGTEGCEFSGEPVGYYIKEHPKDTLKYA